MRALMKNKLPIIVMFVVVALVGFGIYYVINHYINKPEETVSPVSSTDASKNSSSSEPTFDEKTANVPAGGYKDPENRYWIKPPEKWQIIDKDFALKKGKDALPSNLKGYVKPDNIDVMFMDLSTPNQFGSNMNIIVLDSSQGLFINDVTFAGLKDEIIKQYTNMKLDDFKMINAEIVNLSGINSASFELSFNLLGDNLRIIQVIVPGSRAAAIITYTLNADIMNEDLRKQVEESYKSYIPNKEKGF